MKENLRAERTMRNLVNCIQANTYRQIKEQTKCLDGKIEKSFKVFKTTNKIEIGKSKESTFKKIHIKDKDHEK